MKNIMRFFSVIALGAVLVAASCTNDISMGPSPVVDGAFIHSSLGNATIGVFANDPQFVVPIMRTNKSGALTVQLGWTSENMAILSSPPTSVSFSDGQDRVELAVPVNVDIMELEVPVGVSIALKDNATPYGLSAATMSIVKPLVYGPVQVGKFTDGAMGATFYGGPFDSFVKFQKAEGLDIYRLIDAYQPPATYEGFSMGNPDILSSEMTSGDHFIVIDATNPEAVILEEQSIGVDWGYGGVMKIAGENPGTLVNNVVTIQVWFDIGDGRGNRGIDIFDFNTQTP